MTIASLIRAMFGVSDGTEKDDPTGRRFRIKAAVALLIFYAAMHLAVGGVLRLLSAETMLVDVQAGCMQRACANEGESP